MALPYTNTFTAANGTLLTDHDADWTAIGGNGKIWDNRLRGNDESWNLCRYDGERFADNQYAQADSWHGLGGNFGIAVRMQADGSCYYVVVNDNAVYLRRLNDPATDSWTALADYSDTYADGDTVRLEAAGSTLRVYMNGTLVITHTDATYSTGNPGAIFSNALGSTNLDNIELGNLPGEISVDDDSDVELRVTTSAIKSKEWTVSNIGGSAVTVTTSSTLEVGSVAVVGSPIAGGSDATVTLSIDGTSVDPGVYSGTVTITNATNNKGDTTINVVAVVADCHPQHRLKTAAPGHFLFSAVDRRDWEAPSSPAVTGVTIIQAGNGNSAGTGTLYYRDNSGTDELSWKAPGDTQGSWVAVATDGPYDLVSNNGYARIAVYVDNSELPATAQNDDITITEYDTQLAQPPSWENQPTNITGCRVIWLGTGNDAGVGTLSYNNAGDTLSWTAPGDSAGTAIDVSSDGEYELASDNGALCVVYVDSSALPGSNETDSIGVASGGTNARYDLYRYDWRFGDANCGNWSTTGESKDIASPLAIAGHVYDEDGDYTIDVSVVDELGNQTTYQTFVKLASNWTDYYFDATLGDDATGDGTIGSPYQSLDKMEELAEANVRLLLKCGETWTLTADADQIVSSSDGPVCFDQYGEGDKPIVQSNGSVSNDKGLWKISHDDWRICRINCISNNDIGGKTGGPIVERVLSIRTSNLLIYGCDTNRNGAGNNPSSTDYSAYVDITMGDDNNKGGFYFDEDFGTWLAGCVYGDVGEHDIYGESQHTLAIEHNSFNRTGAYGINLNKNHIRISGAAYHDWRPSEYVAINTNVGESPAIDPGRTVGIQIGPNTTSTQQHMRQVWIHGMVQQFQRTSSFDATYGVFIQDGAELVSLDSCHFRSIVHLNGTAQNSNKNINRVYIRNCTIDINNTSAGGGAIAALKFTTGDGITDVLVANNIIYAPDQTDGINRPVVGYSGDAADTENIKFRNNCYYTADRPTHTLMWTDGSYNTLAEMQALVDDTGSVNADPLFTDYAAGDVTLQAGSPCLEAGSDDYVTQAGRIDAAGNYRALSDPDIGAYAANYIVDPIAWSPTVFSSSTITVVDGSPWTDPPTEFRRDNAPNIPEAFCNVPVTAQRMLGLSTQFGDYVQGNVNPDFEARTREDFDSNTTNNPGA